jgi:hypothetical protein
MRVTGRVALQPGHVARLWCCTRDDKEFVFLKPRHSKIRFDAAALVQPLGVDDAARLDIDIRGADSVQHLAGIASLDRIFGKTRLVEEGAVGHQLLCLVARAGEPVLAAIAVLIFRLYAIARIPVGALPAVHFTEDGAQFLCVRIKRRTAHTAGRLGLAIGPMHGVEETQALRHAVAHIGLDRLERVDAADIHATDIHRRVAVLDPLREDETRAAR